MAKVWTQERLLYAWDRHLHHENFASLAEELSETWQYRVTETSVQKAMRAGWPNHPFRTTLARELRAKESHVRREMVEAAAVVTVRNEVSETAVNPTSLLPAPGAPTRIVVIPDTQVRPGVPTDHLIWLGRYIREHGADIIVHLGDHWDMPSLSSYDEGKRGFHERRYVEDVQSGNVALEALTDALGDAAPRRILLRGNHENRIERLLDVEPRLEGAVSLGHLESPGWEVHDFLTTVDVQGVLFSHYFVNPLTGRPISGTAHNLLAKVGRSCVQGHRQVLDSAVRYLPDGTQQRALVCGSFYQHFEDYRGPQANGEWRGVVILNEVQDGTWDQCEVSLGYLQRNYS